MKTQPHPTISVETNDRDRLALLWKAFEDAELRIAELESELDRRRAAPSSSGTAQVRTVQRSLHEEETRRDDDARRDEIETLARAQTQLREAQEDRAKLQQKIADTESRLLAAETARQRERARAERAMQNHDLARAAHLRDQSALLDAQEKLVTILKTLDASRENAIHVQERNDALVRELRAFQLEYASALEAVHEADLKIAHQDGELEVIRLLHASMQRHAQEAAEKAEDFAHLRQHDAEVEQQLHELSRLHEDTRADLNDAREKLAQSREELARAHREREFAESQAVDMRVVHDATARELREMSEARSHAEWERDVAGMMYAGVESERARLADELGALAAWAATARRPVMPSALPLIERYYPIDTSRVSEIHGIHDDEVAALRSVGINLADALLYADLARVHDAIGIGMPRLAKLRALAELMAIRGIGPEWAECCWKAGMRTIEDLLRIGSGGIERLILAHSQRTMDEEGYALAARTVPARAKAIFAECCRHAAT